jgi:hypothetical protein
VALLLLYLLPLLQAVAALSCVIALGFYTWIADQQRALIGITWFADGEWRASTRSNQLKSVLLASPLFVTSVLTVLRFKSSASPWVCHYAILSVDNCDPETFRRLRIRLLQEHSSG